MITRALLFLGVLCWLLPFLAGGLQDARQSLFIVGAIFLAASGVTAVITRQRS